MQKLARITTILLILFSLWPVAQATATVSDPPLVEPDVLRALNADPETPLRIIVTLRPAGASVTAPEVMSAVSRAALVETLQDNFADALEPVAALLAESQRQGEVLARQDLWIIRATALTASVPFVRQLMASPAVAEIRLDHYEQYIVPDQPAGPESASVASPTWGLTQIHAPEVWATLGISGTGAVVAVMDTGVELVHPALTANYRGNLGRGLFNHTFSWFDVVNGGVYPYDDHGHGTHVAGTAVGLGNIGVAPGAHWIGVKVLSGEGYGYDSWIHAGFQWLLAPGGDPALAPDVVNNSWSSVLAAQTTFAEDIALLQAASIVPLFAAGNNGPSPGSLGSPASNPGVFAVGASDPDDEVAYFSSRGPSPWGEIKPYIVAPGVNVLSSIPGGVYGYKSGTSMATPHVAGLVALLRSADPTLSVGAISTLITQTAIPLNTTIPNNDSGWGRIDAFAAVAAATHAGLIAGSVAGPNRQGIANAVVTAAPRSPFGSPARTTTDASANYALALAPTVYDVTAAAFGYAPETLWNVPVFTDTRRQLDFALLPLPTGTLQGRVTVAGANVAPTRTVVARALNTPVTTTVNAAGDYSLKLPAGVYTIELRGLGYRVATATVSVPAGQTTLRNFTLTPAPTLLLVDEGAWYYSSQTPYWKAALDALAYTYDEQRIKFPPAETPISATLAQYDIVLWSSPKGSPGLVQGGGALDAYLKNGGRLLLSGQDVAYFDGGGYFYTGLQPYLIKAIGAGYSADDAPTRQLTGLGPFAGLTVTIEGGDGADNQFAPDVITVREPDKAELLWQYGDGSGGGVGTSVCTPYRAVFLPFGYEAIAVREQREDVLARSLDWLMTPPPPVALELKHLSDPLHIGLPGETVTHTLRLRHTGYGGLPTPVTLTLSSAAWPAALTLSTVTLAACESITLTVVVTIPAESGINVSTLLTVTAASPFLTTETSLTLRVKTPAPVLLVDDDRWYPMETRYTSALSARNIPFDVWDNMDSLGGIPGERSPDLAVLRRYPLIVWFTGYDWYAPILAQEATALLAYLDGGGRLLLSSQDFLYYNNDSPLARRFGVLRWNESLNPTAAFGVPGHPAGGTWGPVKLEFPFYNWADAIEPVPGVVPITRGQLGQPLALAATEAISLARTLFYAFPLETLPFDARATALEQGVGWLSPLGTSQWTVAPTAPSPGERVTHTLVLVNDAPDMLRVNVTHILPRMTTFAVDTLPPAWDYTVASRTLTWNGDVQPHMPLTFTWAVTATDDPGAIIPLSLTLGLPAWGFAFNRETALRVAGGDLSASAWVSPEWAAIRAGTPVTLAFTLRNTGPGNVNGGTARLWLTQESTPITATLPYTRGWNVAWWAGNLGAGETRTLAIPLRAWVWETPLRVDAILEDNTGQRWEQRLWLNVEPWRLYLPVICKQL
ncbi:MAG TPA: S8 family serine peptidase [Anaerolineae bacterium]|nr:S8 family serine peptidase [Anaerolineae bacterium]HQI84483.1 S8 family serine peptidase [Anaerolineae bacterium]